MSSFTDRDKGWKKFTTSFKANAGETVGFVGYLRSSGNYKNKEMLNTEAKESGKEVRSPAPITLAQLAAVHEFGSSDGRIPQRSFLGSTLDEQDRNIKRMIKAAALKVSLGESSKKKAIGVICQKLLDLFVAKIKSNVPPPLKDATVKAKGSTKTLFDTGQLSGSMDFTVKEGKEK